MPPKRTAFTLDEKLAIRKHHQQQPSLSQKDLCDWFEVSFGKPIRQNTVSEVLSNRYSHLDEVLLPTQLSSKKQRLQAYPELEEALSLWVVLNQAQVAITADVLRMKAREIWYGLPQYQNLAEPVLSNGWLHAFKQRHDLGNPRGDLVRGKFDVDSLLAELTTEEKVSLLAGMGVFYRQLCIAPLILNRQGLLAHSGHSQTEDSFHSPFRRTQWHPRNSLLRQHAFSMSALWDCHWSDLRYSPDPPHR
jgi:hypothetical protein